MATGGEIGLRGYNQAYSAEAGCGLAMARGGASNSNVGLGCEEGDQGRAA